MAEKIRKQEEHLRYWRRPEADMLNGYINEIEFDDVTNREGHAAKVYFNALFGMDFTRTAENSLNAALNYGYALLLSTFNRCVVANGYLTQLGLFHDNMFNPFNLSSDLMEPYRPLVDYYVKQTSVYKGYKQDKIEMRGDRAEMSYFPLYLNTVAGGLDRRDQTIGGFSFVVKIYAVPVVEIIG